MKIVGYLSFNGNCRAAMLFYQQCLGGDLFFQTIGESPLSEQMPQKMKDYILHASLRKGNMELMATDLVASEEHSLGTVVSLLLQCSTKKEMENSFNSLAVGGTEYHELEKTHFGGIIGGLRDQFGIQWVFYLPQKRK